MTTTTIEAGPTGFSIETTGLAPGDVVTITTTAHDAVAAGPWSLFADAYRAARVRAPAVRVSPPAPAHAGSWWPLIAGLWLLS